MPGKPSGPKRPRKDKKDKDDKWAKKGKRKFCIFCKDKVDHVDYKDVITLRKFTSERGKLRIAAQWCVVHPATADTGVATWGGASLPSFLAAFGLAALARLILGARDRVTGESVA